MADTPISALPLRLIVNPNDEVPTVAGGVNYRSPLSALLPALGGGEFNTVADMLASTDAAYGTDTVWRAAGFRYREAAFAATDHHLTTAGGVKLYVQPGDDGWYNFLAMNPARDNVTNDADKLKKLLAIRPYAAYPHTTHWPKGPSIQIPQGSYYMDAGPWGFQLKAVTHLRGEGHAPDNAFVGTTLRFPADVVGFMVNHYDTLENMTEDTPGWTGGALGSTIERMAIVSLHGTGSNPDAHGIWAKITVHIRDVAVYGFFGHGICITGSGSVGPYWVSGTNYAFNQNVKGSNKVIYYCAIDPGGVITSVNEPTHINGVQAYPDGYSWGIYHHGGPSMCSFTNVTLFYNHNCGMYIYGHDASVMTGVRMDVYANGRWGIYDDSFLGNTWVMVHSEGNGLGTRGGNPSDVSSCVRMDLGGDYWDFYYAVHTATEAQLVATTPGTDEDIWRIFRPNLYSPASVDDHQHPLWLPGQPVGTYFVGGSFWSGGSSPRNTFIGCYAELSEAFGVLGPVSISIGGIARWHQGESIDGVKLAAAYEGVGGIMTSQSGYRTQDKNDNVIIVGADAGSSDTTFTAMSFWAKPESHQWRWRYDDALGDWFMDFAGSTKAYNLTSNRTVNKMGTSKTQPTLLHVPTLAIGNLTNTRRQTASSAKPTTGEWAAGDITWNTISTNRFAGWRCTAAGAFGATAWVTGTNYALNVIILASGGKYYRCSLDPGAGLSTVEPSHASGEVIEADGYGWTWVSNSVVEFSPFGESINTYEHTSTGVGLSLSVQTHPVQIIYSATVATTVAVSISTAGAYKGARFRFTRTDAGAGTLNLGTGPLKAMPARSWADVVYDGTAWFLSAYGTL